MKKKKKQCLFSCEIHSMINTNRIASDNTGMFFPCIVGQPGFLLGFPGFKDGIQFLESLFPVQILAAFFGSGNSYTSGKMYQADTGFDLVYILSTVAAAVKTFKSYTSFHAYFFRFRDDTDIHKPVFSFMMRTKGTLTNPLYGPFQIRQILIGLKKDGGAAA